MRDGLLHPDLPAAGVPRLTNAWLGAWLAFALLDLLSGGLGSALGLVIPGLLWDGEWYRLLVACSLHGHPLQLLANLVLLYLVGPVVERTYGRWRMAFALAFTGLFAGVASAAILPADAVATGSGSTLGLVGLVFGLLTARRALDAQALEPRAHLMLGLGVMLNVAAGLFADHANNVVHLSGLLAGYLLSVVLEPRRQGERRPVLALVTATTLAATFAVLLERSRTAAVGTLPWAIVASEMDELAGRLDPAIARLEDAFGRGEEGSANQLLLPFAQNQLAWYYVEAGRNLERALVLSEESNRLRPSLPMFLDTLGYVYAMLGRCPEAADRMGQAADLDPGYGRRRDEVNGACAAGRRPDPDLPVDPPPAETPPPGQRMRV